MDIKLPFQHDFIIEMHFIVS